MKVSSHNLSVDQNAKTAELRGYQGDAKQFLKDVAADLVNKDGTIKGGYLRLKAGSQNVTVTGGHMGSGASLATKLMTRLVKEAYGEPAAQALDQYLSSTSAKNGGVGKIGTRSFVALIRTLEQGALKPQDSSVDAALQRATRIGKHRLVTDTLSPIALDRAQSVVVQPDPSAASETLENPIVKPEAFPLASAQPEALESKQVADVPLGMAQPKVVQDKQVEPDHGPADQVQDIDVPDLIDLTVAAKATDPLKKSHRLSVEFDGPALTAKQFNLLDSGPHRALGTAINQKLADGGLYAPRGVSKIEVNGEPVYCYFDETGKARAVLPKRIQDLPVEFHVKTLNLHVSEDALDFYRQIGKSGSGKKIKLGDSPAFNRLFTSCVLETLGKSIGVDPDDISGAHRKLSPLLREMLQPLDQGQRMVVQFKFGDAHWVADLSLRPGKKLSGINTDSFDSDVSITLSPLDAPLPEGAIATSQLNELAPQGLWDKNAHVKVSADYGGVRTTADAGYVKKFYQVSSNKSDFFEHLLASEEQSPGIANRMLVGVPTADMKKSIGPSGPLTILSKVPIPDARLEEFKLAAFTAVDDLFVLCRAGFAPPESKPEHFLLDPTADKLEIKMIDFGIGKHSDVQRRKKLFRDSVDILAGYVATALKNKSKDSARSPDEFAAEVRAYADKRLTSF